MHTSIILTLNIKFVDFKNKFTEDSRWHKSRFRKNSHEDTYFYSSYFLFSWNLRPWYSFVTVQKWNSVCTRRLLLPQPIRTMLLYRGCECCIFKEPSSPPIQPNGTYFLHWRVKLALHILYLSINGSKGTLWSNQVYCKEILNS